MSIRLIFFRDFLVLLCQVMKLKRNDIFVADDFITQEKIQKLYNYCIGHQ